MRNESSSMIVVRLHDGRYTALPEGRSKKSASMQRSPFLNTDSEQKYPKQSVSLVH